jgi:hypothetical protein
MRELAGKKKQSGIKKTGWKRPERCQKWFRACRDNKREHGAITTPMFLNPNEEGAKKERKLN